MLLLTLWASPVAAWNEAGHMTAALIAYDRLPAAVQVSAVRLLRAHPRFHADFETRLPRSLVAATAAQQDRWYFAVAAMWPDIARRFDDEHDAATRSALVARYHHGGWHYINLPTYLRTSDEKAIHAATPSMRWSADLSDDRLNLVQALEKLTTQWCVTGQSDAQRAVALSWLVHLIADLHQPLHTTALYAIPLYVSGDRGGNDITVTGGANLHAVWDAAFGTDLGPRRLDALAHDYGGAATADPVTLGVATDPARDFRRWTKQGRDLAARVVYTETIRSAVSTATDARPPRVRLDADYRAEVRAPAQRQIALAGQRIAWVTQTLFAQTRSACGR